jgi:hypothetical protein
MSVADATSGTASAGLIRYPAGAPFTMNVKVPNFAAYDLTGKFVTISFTKKCEGPTPTLFSVSTGNANGAVSLADEGTADQVISILILPSYTSEHDSSAIFSRKVSIENLTVEFAIDVKSSSTSPLAWRIQGDALWQEKHGKFTL